MSQPDALLPRPRTPTYALSMPARFMSPRDPAALLDVRRHRWEVENDFFRRSALTPLARSRTEFMEEITRAK